MPEHDFHVVGGKEEDIARWKRMEKMNNLLFHGRVAPYQEQVAFSHGGTFTTSFLSPLKLFEYMSSKRAIICSDIPVLREALNDETALLVPSADTVAWCEAIKKLENPSVRSRYAENAYQRFIQEFTWKARAAAILKSMDATGA